MTTAERITLRGRERRQLQQVVRAHTSEQRYVLRARIVLLAALAWNNCQIAHELGCDRDTVRKWRGRFASKRVEGLYDAPRSGRPACFSSTQKHDVFSLVVGPPPSPYARWSVDLIAAELIKQGLVPSIGRETVSLWLRTADVKPHRVKYWLTSNDPDFKQKKDRIVELYLHPPEDGVVISVDEKTSIQALERSRRQYPTAPGRVRRLDFEYKRHGVVNLMAAFNVGNGSVIGECVDKNDSAAFIRFVRRIMEAHPTGKIYLILDNGTTHRSKETTRFFEETPRLIPVFTPTHASWLNQVEIWFSMLSRQALRHVSFPNQEALRDRILQYIQTYNATARAFNWSSKGQPLAGRKVMARRRQGPRRQRHRSRPQGFPTVSRRPGRKARKSRDSR